MAKLVVRLVEEDAILGVMLDVETHAKVAVKVDVTLIALLAPVAQDALDVPVLVKTAVRADVIPHALLVQEPVLPDVVIVAKISAIQLALVDAIQHVLHVVTLALVAVDQLVGQLVREFVEHLVQHNVLQTVLLHAEITVAEQLHNKDIKEKYNIWLKLET